MERKAERHALPPATEEIHQHLAARERAGNVLEHDTRCVLAVKDDLGGRADILLPIEPADFADLAELSRLLDPLPQIRVGDPWPQIRAARAARPRGIAYGIRHIGGFVVSHCALLAPALRLSAAFRDHARRMHAIGMRRQQRLSIVRSAGEVGVPARAPRRAVSTTVFW